MLKCIKTLILCSLRSREANIDFFVADPTAPVLTVKSFDDIGPEFSFSVKVELINQSHKHFNKFMVFNGIYL